jgi:hypothetical protein
MYLGQLSRRTGTNDVIIISGTRIRLFPCAKIVSAAGKMYPPDLHLAIGLPEMPFMMAPA